MITTPAMISPMTAMAAASGICLSQTALSAVISTMPTPDQIAYAYAYSFSI